MRRTKILATLGPASSSKAVIKRLIEAGANAFRLNFSHSTHEGHARLVRIIREIAEELQVEIPILADLQGPKIRTGSVADGPLQLTSGDELTITTRDVEGKDGIISTTYPGLPRDCDVGDRILLDDGKLSLIVEDKTETDIRCRVETGGPLGPSKGINLPGVPLSAPAMTEKDREDAIFAAGLGVDVMALSFVRKPEDVVTLRNLLKQKTDVEYLPLVAKIEKPQAMQRLDEILKASDGIMVARGDLGVEVSIEKIPAYQKIMIEAANAAGRFVITATQMLDSMIENPRPTRAEVTDIANAILDGTDAIMLSGETAYGKYPVESVLQMARIAEETEQALMGRLGQFYANLDRTEPYHNVYVKAAVQAACYAAKELRAKAIVVFTESGETARLVSIERPEGMILAMSPNQRVRRTLGLTWGVQPIPISDVSGADDLLHHAEQALLDRGVVQTGDGIVILSGSSHIEEAATMVKLHQVGRKEVDYEPVPEALHELNIEKFE